MRYVGCSRTTFGPAQQRAARAMLGWSLRDLCIVSGVPAEALRQFEAGGSLQQNWRNLMRDTLNAAGVVVIYKRGEPGCWGVAISSPAHAGVIHARGKRQSYAFARRAAKRGEFL